ncbi:MAG: patatin-like phospholipase family protein [Bacteroidetes bacterium]|nr:patatin-like phospholipase family protein [Bacteroidota bacterium]
MSKKIGLALGAGSARGLSLIGVLKAFDHAGIKPAYICGTSIGSMIGAVYASGNLDAVEKLMRTITLGKMANYLDFTIPRQALMEGDKIMELIHEIIPVSDFSELSIPFSAVACDIHTGRQVLLDTGDVHTAVRASISLPGIFLPVKHEGMWLVDGGLVNPVPVSVVREQDVDIVIAVDLNNDVLDANGQKRSKKSKKVLKESKKVKAEPNPVEAENLHGLVGTHSNFVMSALGKSFKEMERSVRDTFGRWMDDDEKADDKAGKGPSIFDALAFSIDIMSVQITRRNFEKCPADLYINPAVGHLGLFDYDEASPTIDDGYQRTMRLIEEEKLAE